MKEIILFVLLILSLFNISIKMSNSEIVVTVPVIKFIVDKITKDEKLSIALVKENTDPHFFDAKLSTIVKLKRAQLFILLSSDFEVYVDALLQTANNKNILKGGDGYLELANFVDLIDIPSNIERTGGELHAHGNPHFILSPYNFKKSAQAIFSKLKKLYPHQEKTYKENLNQLLRELDTILFGEKLLGATKSDMLYKRWELEKLKEYLEEKGLKDDWNGLTRKISEIKNEKIIPYHKSFTYFIQFFKLDEFAVIEPKPGIPPSTSHLISLIDKSNKENVKVILIEPFYPLKTANFIKEKVKGTLCVIISSTNVYNYFEWLKITAEKIHRAIKDGKCE